MDSNSNVPGEPFLCRIPRVDTSVMISICLPTYMYYRMSFIKASGSLSKVLEALLSWFSRRRRNTTKAEYGQRITLCLVVIVLSDALHKCILSETCVHMINLDNVSTHERTVGEM